MVVVNVFAFACCSIGAHVSSTGLYQTVSDGMCCWRSSMLASRVVMQDFYVSCLYMPWHGFGCALKQLEGKSV